MFLWVLLLFLFAVSGCGGGGGDSDYSISDDAGGSDGGEVDFESLGLGSMVDGVFTPGRIAVSIPDGEMLAFREIATLEATIADGQGDRYTSPVEVTFSSNFQKAGQAELDDVVTTSNGSATASYTALGGSGVDTVTATAIVGQKTLTATASIRVIGPDPDALEFVSATHGIIALRGTGGSDRAETSRLIFRAVDDEGNPLPGLTVDFELSTEVGLPFDGFTGITDADGLVDVTVTSGDVATSLRVRAIIRDTAISTLSDVVMVSTGLPDQENFSLLAADLGFDSTLGYRYSITAHAFDHFNNPVPDGAVISFSAEQGQIQDQCVTTDGLCTVTWQDTIPPAGVAILATMLGEETFVDVDDDGVFSETDAQEWQKGPFDLPFEPFRDDNQNGVFEQGEEQFCDHNGNGTFDSEKNGIFNGVLCSDAAEARNLCTKELLLVRSSVILGEAVLPKTPESLTFVSAEPRTIALEGTGDSERVEASTLTFQVLDADGDPWPGQAVDFQLTATTGGLSIDPLTATTDVEGLATVKVTSGNLSTSVRLRATVEGTTISDLSDFVVISTALPDQENFSLLAADQGFDSVSGYRYRITAHAFDHFNNPAPDDTAVSFSAEEGQIQDRCFTKDGLCSVMWQHTSPPVGVTILATALGEESFVDVDDDGFFSEIDFQEWRIDKFDLPLEPFRDDNQNGTYEPGSEIFRDYNANGIYNPDKNGIYNGTLCSDEAEAQSLCSKELLLVRSDVVLGAEAILSEARLGAVVDGAFVDGQLALSVGDGEKLAPFAIATVTVMVVDDNGDPIRTPLDIQFASTFADQNKAEIDDSATATDGVATAVYNAKGGVGADTITATLTVAGKTLTAEATIEIMTIKLGAMINGAFVDGQLKLSIPDGQKLTPFGAETVTAMIVDENNDPIQTPLDIQFSSALAEENKAQIDDMVATVDGVATASYKANGWDGLDTITATLTVAGNTITAAAQVEIMGAELGAMINNVFTEGQLALSVDQEAQLAHSGTAEVTAMIVDENGDPIQTPLDILFSSDFTEENKARINDVVTTVDGVAKAEYKADGAAGVDTITATVTVGGALLTAHATIDVAGPPPSSIEFVAAEPDNIVLSGTGGAGRSEVSKVTFQVVDAAGDPAPNHLVRFTLTPGVGGIQIRPTEAVSDVDGFVDTYVIAGNVATSVRVRATVDGTGIETQSDLLVVSTGLPDQESFSLVATFDGFEPGEGYRYVIAANASDHFNNPVPDGTAIYFTTEAGQIQDNCLTTDGFCSAIWRHTSQPQGITVLATAIGEESFIDVDGDGVFGSVDEQNWKTSRFDLPMEPYRDDNENGSFDFGDEEFLDYDGNGVYTGDKDGVYNGTLCSLELEGQGKCTRDLLYVRDSIILGEVSILGGAQLGSMANGVFTEGQLDVSIGPNDQLAPSGTATVTAAIADADGDPILTPLDIEFSSRFTEDGKADIDEVVTTTNGVATAVYRAKGGVGIDTITATVEVAGRTLTAQADIDVAGTPAGSIEFVSADPTSLVLAGTGGANLKETTAVTFRVIDFFGTPSPNQTVDFELSTTVGGIEINPTTAISDSDGLVVVYVKSGSVATSVRVKATVEATVQPADIATQSDSITISTGLPDQNSFSLSAEFYNPEGRDYDGEVVTVSVLLSDHFNNPVPDGTAVSFTTEGGQIEDQCSTINGGCSVQWRSSEPRPPLNGRATILATAVGEESFLDVDGDGRFTAADRAFWLPAVYDLDSEAYRDDDEDASFTFGVEEFVDLDQNGAFDFYTDAIYNGTLCAEQAEAAGECSTDLLNVRASIVLVMSGSFADITITPATVDLTTGTGDSSVDLVISLSDDHFEPQPLPYDTEISVSTSNGVLVGKTNFEVRSTNISGPIELEVTVEREGDPNGKTEGSLQVVAVTPNGNESSATIMVRDDG